MELSLLSATIVAGVINGGLYGLLGLAIVLIFRTTTVANFAQGEMAMFSVFILIMFAGYLPAPLWAQWAVTIAISAGAGALIYLVLLRPNPRAEHLNLTVRTLGLYILIYAVCVYFWGANEPYSVPSLFSRENLSIGGFYVSYDQIGTLAVTAALGAAFLLFFRFTQTGLAMRAVAMNPEVAALLGIDVRRVSLVVWVIAGAIGAVVGLLVAPVSFLDTVLMRPYILKAFTAAILGGLYSFPGVIAGGLVLGLAESFGSIWISIHLREPFTFVILLVVLLVRPGGLFGKVQKVRV